MTNRLNAIVSLTFGAALVLVVTACTKSGESAGSLAGELLGGREIEAAGLKFEVPITWNPVPAREGALIMRAAQLTIPGEGGDAELAVFHFGEGRGGKVEDNLVRWASQVEMAPGKEAQRDYFEQGGFAMTVLTAEGTLRASRFGMGPKEAQPNSMMIAAVVEGTGGPWFFKATGSAKTLGTQRQAFTSMLKSSKRATGR